VRVRSLIVGSLKRIAPVFAVRDLSVSLAHYGRLGFHTREYEGGGYGFATRDGIEIHLGQLPEGDPRAIPGTAYIWVDDADEVAQAWRSAGADVRGPEDTDWGQHEGALVDPDGNVIRFGSPVGRPGTIKR
jgi:catechol 2,3-dioxygenase-like lactoylglutathione lyase family enzyme